MQPTDTSTPPPAPPRPPAPTAPVPSAARRGPTLRRDQDDRLVAGVCAGLARSIGVDPIVVRVSTVALALAGGVGIALYLLAWSFSEEGAAPEPVAITRRQTVALALIVVGMLLLLRDVGLWFGDGLVFPLVLGAIGSAVIWARSDDGDRARWSAMRSRLPGTEHDLKQSPVRVVSGAILIGIGMTTVLAANNALLALRSVALAVITALTGAALVFGPWIARLVRDLADERRERIRGEERAEVAAHLHDSVLQTLALIQRSPDNPRRMVALARSQERELRAWLYGRRESDDGETTLRGLLDAMLATVEAAHELDVDLVVVGDTTPDEDVRALVAAIREALHNAGSHAEVPTASVYVEVEADQVMAFVRDRGRGFDPAAVGDDRRGLADSIKGRMRRHGGQALLTTALGEGTEWELLLPRQRPATGPDLAEPGTHEPQMPAPEMPAPDMPAPGTPDIPEAPPVAAWPAPQEPA